VSGDRELRALESLKEVLSVLGAAAPW